MVELARKPIDPSEKVQGRAMRFWPRFALAVAAVLAAWYVQVSRLSDAYPIHIARDDAILDTAFFNFFDTALERAQPAGGEVPPNVAVNILKQFMELRSDVIRERSCPRIAPCSSVHSQMGEYYRWVSENLQKIYSCIRVIEPFRIRTNSSELDSFLREKSPEFLRLCPTFYKQIGFAAEQAPLVSVPAERPVAATGPSREQRVADAMKRWGSLARALSNEILSSGSPNSARTVLQEHVLLTLHNIETIVGKHPPPQPAYDHVTSDLTIVKLDLGNLMRHLDPQHGEGGTPWTFYLVQFGVFLLFFFANAIKEIWSVLLDAVLKILAILWNHFGS